MKKVICWWSGGITSAVACKVAIDLFGLDNCRIVMIDTGNEYPNTYRFKDDCSMWYGKDIEVITDIGKQYESIQDVWRTHKYLNVATGAICSTQLNRLVREKWQESVDFDHQVFGFEFDKKEFNRAKSLTLNQLMQFIFLKKHPDYPDVICIDDKPEMGVKPLFECNGFCGTNNLNERSQTEGEINMQQTLF